MFDLKSLAAFEGYWSGDSEVSSNPWTKNGPNRGRWVFRFDDAHKNLIHDYEQSGSDGSGFDGHGVFCADPDSDDLIGFWFDDRGLPPLNPARGHWQDNHLVMLGDTKRGLSRSTLYVEDKQLSYVVEVRLSGQEGYSDLLRGQYSRY